MTSWAGALAWGYGSLTYSGPLCRGRPLRSLLRKLCPGRRCSRSEFRQDKPRPRGFLQGIPRYPKLAAWFIGKSIISMVYKWGTPILVPPGPGIIQAHGSGSPLVRSRPYSTKESIEDTHISWPYIKLIQQVAKAWHAWPGVHVELGTSAWSLTINYWIIILVCIYTYTYSNSMDNNSMVRRVNSCWHPCHVQSCFLARKITSINDMCKAVRDLQLM